MSQLTDTLWDRFGSLAFAGVPGDVRQIAQQSILDWFGCAIAGSREPLSQILRDEFARPHGDSALIGTDLRADTLRAAMINGPPGTRKPAGDADERDEQGRRLRAKFDALASPVLGPDLAGELGDRLASLARVGDIAELLTPDNQPTNGPTKADP